MTSDDLLRLAARHHKEWLQIVMIHATSHSERDYAEDFVQEAYLKLHKYGKPDKVAPDGVFNKGYMFFVLKSVLFDYRKSKSKINKVYLEDCTNCDKKTNSGKDDSINKEEMFDKMEGVVDEWYWYDKKLFNLYLKIPSYRTLSKETNISKSSIFKTIKECKNKIYEKLEKDYKEFKEEAQ